MKIQTFYKKKKENPQYYNVVDLHRISAPITILIGPNGSGKTMSLRTIEQELKKANTKVIKYTTSQDDIVQKGAPAFGDWDPWKLAQAFTSEGERMSSSFVDWCNNAFLRGVLETREPLFALIDEADSGLSIDRLIQTIRPLLFIMREEMKKGRELHYVLTCNSYEMLDQFPGDLTEVIWMPTLDSIEFSDYEEFAEHYTKYYEKVLWENDNEE